MPGECLESLPWSHDARPLQRNDSDTSTGKGPQGAAVVLFFTTSTHLILKSQQLSFLFCPPEQRSYRPSIYTNQREDLREWKRAFTTCCEWVGVVLNKLIPALINTQTYTPFADNNYIITLCMGHILFKLRLSPMAYDHQSRRQPSTNQGLS